MEKSGLKVSSPGQIYLAESGDKMLGALIFARGCLSQILWITGGNVSWAARLAKRNRTDLYKLLARQKLTPKEFEQR